MTDEGAQDALVSARGTLDAPGPVALLDGAFVLGRRAPWATTARAWAGGSLPAFVLLALYFAERVEGLTWLRLPFAFALVASFAVRSWTLAAVARDHVRALAPSLAETPDAGRFVDVARTSMFVAAELWFWGWGIVLTSYVGPWLVVNFAALSVLRALEGPSWLARAGSTTEGGFRSYVASWSDSARQRVSAFGAECLLQLGIFALAVNLFGVVATMVTLGRSFFGLELVLVDEFVSLRNTFALLAILLVAIVAVEPIRAGVSAQLYVGARVRTDGLDLESALTKAIQRASTRGAVILALLLFLPSGLVRAEPPTEPPSSAPSALGPGSGSAAPASNDTTYYVPLVPLERPTTSVEQARLDARRILDADIYRDLAERREASLADSIARFLEWLLRDTDVDVSPTEANLPSLPLPGPEFFLGVGIAIVLGIAAFLLVTRRRSEAPASAATDRTHVEEDPRGREAHEWIDDAASLAARGAYAEAIRAAYLATLVALDRKAWIRFERSTTNWQYQRQIPHHAAREAFRALTGTFDRTVYGREMASEEDYLRCRQLATSIVATSTEERAS